MNIFSKNVKKSLVWKTLNVLVVFSLVSSCSLPLASVVYAEDAEVSVSDDGSVSDSGAESATEESVSEESGDAGSDSGLTEEELRAQQEALQAEEDARLAAEAEANAQNEAGNEETVGDESGDGTPPILPPNFDPEAGNNQPPVGGEVLGTSEETPADNGDGGSSDTKKTFESADEEAFYENEQISKSAVSGIQKAPVMGSLRVCKVTLDAQGGLNTQQIASGATFTIEGNGASTDSATWGSPTALTPTSTFDTPLTLNTDLFGNDQINDAECITYSGLQAKNPGYYYKAETITPATGWDVPLYNDQFGVGSFGQGSNFSINKFSGFTNQLFDGVAGNDDARNQTADGHVVLSPSRPDRTVVVVNRYTSSIIPEDMAICHWDGNQAGPNSDKPGHYVQMSVPANSHDSHQWDLMTVPEGGCPGDNENPQCEESFMSIVSDTNVTVVENANANAVATTTHPAWTANIPGATWIWETLLVLTPTQTETKTFEKTFTVNGVVTDSDLTIAADNQYKVWINGNLIGQDATEFNYSLSGQDEYADISPAFFNDGQNTIKVEVINMAGSANPLENPAGALFDLQLSTEDCGDDQCTEDPLMARVVVENFANTNKFGFGGKGDASSNVFVGGTTPIASGTWFALDTVDPIMEGNYDNVPGVAVQRYADNKLRVLLQSQFVDEQGNREHVDGYVELSDGTILSLENDMSGDNKVERPTDGSKWPFPYSPTNDEYWMADGNAHFWFSTDSADDAFFVHYQGVDSCDDPEVPICGNDIIEQGEQCELGDENCNELCQLETENPTCNPEVNLLLNAGFEDVQISQAWDIVNSGTPGLSWLVNWMAPIGTMFNGDMIPAVASLEIHHGVNGWLPSEGLQYAELDGDWGGPLSATSGEPASVAISQTIATIPGATYTISADFSARSDTWELDNALALKADGNLLGQAFIAQNLTNQTDWNSVSRTFVATNTSTVITFEDMAGNDSIGTFIDNTSVTCTENPGDGDGNPTCGNGIVEGNEACDGDENCTEQCTVDDGGNGGESETCGDGELDQGEACDAGPGGSSTCSTSCTVIDDGNGGNGDNNNGGGGSGGGSSRSGSRGGNPSTTNDGEVLGDSTGPEVLGASLAQTGVDFSPISFVALLALALFIIARRKEDKKLA